MSRALRLGACALVLLGCGGDDETSLGPTPRYRIPGCEAYDTAPCDVRLTTCQERLLQLAVCLRQDEPATLPPVSIMSPEEYADVLREGALAREPVPELPQIEAGYTRFGLVERGGFDSTARIDALVAWLWGVYRSQTKDIVIIDHGTDTDLETSSDALVHEFVHALQDRELGLDAWSSGRAPDFDTHLALKSLIEGEARLHETRYRAAMLGLDPRRVDWRGAFQNEVLRNEKAVLDDSSPLLAAQQVLPYGWGARFLDFDWDATGRAGIVARFATPPTTSHAFMASLDSAVEDAFVPSSLELPAPPAGWRSLGDDSLGALGVFLLTGKTAGADRARELALTWRGDRFGVYASVDALGAAVTVAVWVADFASEAAAADVARWLMLPAATEARVPSHRLTVVAHESATDVSWALPPSP